MSGEQTVAMSVVVIVAAKIMAIYHEEYSNHTISLFPSSSIYYGFDYLVHLIVSNKDLHLDSMN
jgi:hypothetical protein